MCLAIPAKVAALEEGNLATVDILGVTREISVDLTPQAQVGDYVLVHAASPSRWWTSSSPLRPSSW